MYKFICSICKNIENSDAVLPDSNIVDEDKPNKTLEEMEKIKVLICADCNTGTPHTTKEEYRKPTNMEYAIASFSKYNAITEHDQSPKVLETVDGKLKLNQLGIAIYNTMYTNAKEKELTKIDIKSHPLYQKLLVGYDVTIEDVINFDLNNEEACRIAMMDVSIKSGNINNSSNIRIMTPEEEKRIKRDKKRKYEIEDKRKRTRANRKKKNDK